MNKQFSIEKLPRYFYVFAVINVIIFTGFSIFIIFQSQSVQKSEQLLSYYHLPLATNLQQLEHELTHLRNTLKNNKATPQKIKDLIYQIETHYQQAQRMQDQWEGSVNTTLHQRYDAFHQSLKNIDSSAYIARIDKFLLATQQFRLLNQQKIEKLTTNLGKQQRKATYLMTTAIATAILLGVLLFIRISVLIKRAITRQQKIESELIQHRSHLEEEVRRRTRELEASNQELEAYSYSIAHDLRAPLRSITSFSQIVMEDASDYLHEDDKQHLQRVINGGKHMAKLIDDLLTVARITRSELTKNIVNLSEMAEEILHGFHQANPERDVKWEIQTNMTILGDPEMLRLTLSNLLDNAWKYTAKIKSTRIIFGCNQHDGMKTYFIKDNGAGFNMQYADKLFTSFQRLHSPNEFKGSGIGLATVARIIHRHGGKIWAEAEVNKGACFYFQLPM